MSSRKPTLALTTPISATFPAEALRSAASVRTPHSAIWRESAGLSSAGLPSAGLPSAGLSSAGLQSPIVAIKTEEGLIKTPISPPIAYMDFLKLASPVATSPCTSSPITATAAHSSTCPKPKALHRASISGPLKMTPSNLSTSSTATSSAATAPSASLSDEESNNDTEKDSLESGPSSAASASSTESDCCSCEYERAHKSPKIARIDTSMPASPFAASNYPMSAPAIGRTTFPSLKIPISPAISNASQINSPIRSPFSAKSTITSPFDWEAALKARYAEFKSPQSHAHSHSGCTKCGNKTSAAAAPATAGSCAAAASTAQNATAAAKTSVRHIREVVTRTVTYTPRMNPAPKGKKRKISCDDAA